jgi:hypothetical protein
MHVETPKLGVSTKVPRYLYFLGRHSLVRNNKTTKKILFMKFMNIHPVLLIITLALSGLAGYAFFVGNSGEQYQLLIAIGGGVTVFLPLSGMIALSSDIQGIAGNIRALSSVFLVLEIISNLFFSMTEMTAPTTYIIVNGILILLHLLICYAMSRALK